MSNEAATQPYAEQKFNLTNLDGLSQNQIEQHLALYAGYVKNTNLLLDNISKARKENKLADPSVAEQRRRLGFEFCGMRLHEFYFSALGGNKTKITQGGALHKAIEREWGSYDNWVTEFKAVGMMRGIGWALLVRDPLTDRLTNIWVTDHENAHFVEARPIVVMDVWEHAYCVDFKPTQRKDYIEAYFANLNFAPIEKRWG